jgi:hypothetical protein
MDDITVYSTTDDDLETQNTVEVEQEITEKKSFIERAGNWIKKHKKGLALTGVGVGIIIWALLNDKNKEEDIIPVDDRDNLMEHANVLLKQSFQSEEMPIEDPEDLIDDAVIEEQVKDIVKRSAHRVSGHPRNLPTGQHASAEKRKAAEENGVILAEGQTYVEDYHTGDGVA